MQKEQAVQLRNSYQQVASITVPYMENSLFLFFISEAGCHGDNDVNFALYDALTLFRAKYTLEATSSNKYAIAMFFNQFLNDQNEKIKTQEATEESIEFFNFFFYMKYQIMIQMAAFVPENIEGQFYFTPLTETQEQFINDNINKLCIEESKRNEVVQGKSKHFLSSLNGLVFYVLD